MAPRHSHCLLCPHTQQVLSWVTSYTRIIWSDQHEGPTFGNTCPHFIEEGIGFRGHVTRPRVGGA